jgi:hypothetical protein
MGIRARDNLASSCVPLWWRDQQIRRVAVIARAVPLMRGLGQRGGDAQQKAPGRSSGGLLKKSRLVASPNPVWPRRLKRGGPPFEAASLCGYRFSLGAALDPWVPHMTAFASVSPRHRPERAAGERPPSTSP